MRTIEFLTLTKPPLRSARSTRLPQQTEPVWAQMAGHGPRHGDGQEPAEEPFPDQPAGVAGGGLAFWIPGGSKALEALMDDPNGLEAPKSWGLTRLDGFA